MINFFDFKKISVGVIALLIAGQLAFSFSFLLVPKRAEASLWGIDFSIVLGDIPEKLLKIAEGAMMRIAQDYANKYLTRFVQKLTDKFKIRDFLNYDKYLSDYYLSNLIMDKIDDPDLRQAFDLYYQTTVTGRIKDPYGAKAIVPQLKKKIADYYISQTGVDSSKLYNPPAGMTDAQYFAMARSYYSNPPSFTEENLRAQFGEYQSAATTASQLEIAVGGGSKTGRVIVGSCSAPSSPGADRSGSTREKYEEFKRLYPSNPWNPYDLDGNRVPDAEQEWIGQAPSSLLVKLGLVKVAQAQTVPNTGTIKDPVACANAGGKWNQGALDRARSFIDNPTAKVNEYMASAIKQIFGINYDSSNPYTKIGGALGNFVFNQLLLDRSDDTFHESNYNYLGDDGSLPTIVEIDLDNDGIPDGQDVDGNGTLDGITDTCYHGGIPNVPPGCKKSSQVSGSPYFTPLCQSLDRTILEMQSYLNFITTHQDQINGDNFINEADADVWAQRSLKVYSVVDDLLNEAQRFHSLQFEDLEIALGRFNSYMNKVIDSLNKDNDLDLAKIGNGGGGISNLINNTTDMLDYLQDVKFALNKCDDPNFDAVSQVVAPVIQILPDNGGGGGGGGIVGTATYSGFVFNDLNANGAMDAGEPGIQGIRVRVTVNSTQVEVAAIQTDTSGSFNFTDLTNGNSDYRLSITVPSGWQATNDTSFPFTAQGDKTYNFGLKQ